MLIFQQLKETSALARSVLSFLCLLLLFFYFLPRSFSFLKDLPHFVFWIISRSMLSCSALIFILPQADYYCLGLLYLPARYTLLCAMRSKYPCCYLEIGLILFLNRYISLVAIFRYYWNYLIHQSALQCGAIKL